MRWYIANVVLSAELAIIVVCPTNAVKQLFYEISFNPGRLLTYRNLFPYKAT